MIGSENVDRVLILLQTIHTSVHRYSYNHMYLRRSLKKHIDMY